MQEKSKEYNEKEQQIAENRSRNTLFERRENLQKHESYARQKPTTENATPLSRWRNQENHFLQGLKS